MVIFAFQVGLGAGPVSGGNVLVTGHSFVRRLADAVGKSHEIDGYRYDVEGVGGLKVGGLEDRLASTLLTRRYCCVAVEIGSNDLCGRDVTADSVARGIFGLCRRLREEFGVARVVVFEILLRQRECKWMEVGLEVYNTRVRLTNQLMVELCSDDASIIFRTHHREAKRLGEDGIHIGERWMDKYWRSVKGGVKAALTGVGSG
jgi:hypothetical protein